MNPSTDEFTDSSRTIKRSEIWKDFYENSTLHGLRNVFASKRLCQRIIWLVLLLVCIAYFILCIAGSVNRFLQYPTTIVVDETLMPSLPFPAITICPLNYLDNYKVHALDGDQVFEDYKLNISACAATAEIRGGDPCGRALVCAFMDHPTLIKQRLPNCTDEYKQKISEALNKANISFDKLEFLRKFVETRSEVFIFCVLGSVLGEAIFNCSNPRHYKLTQSRYGLLCHTFNDDTFEDLPIQSEAEGISGGLTFFLKHRPERYFYPMFAEGFSVNIHSQKTGLGVTEILAPPGRYTGISLEKNRILKIEKSEGGKCERKTLQGFKQYTQRDCFSECVSNATKDVCGCRISQPGEYNDSMTCHSAHIQCVHKVYGNLDFQNCPCPVSCDEMVFKTSVSYGSLPSLSTAGVTQMFPFKDFSPEKCASITVYFSTHRISIYRQQLAFGITSLLGEIGGNMGLLLGCSLMTVVEFIFLLVSLIASFFKPKSQVRETASQTEQAWN